MRIIIAPAKQMKEDTNTLPYAELPVFLDKAERLKNYVNSLSYDEQKRLWACSDKIAQENRVRFAETDLRKRLTPAILAYDGVNLLNASDESAGQSVPHFHIHIIPRKRDDGIDGWPVFKGAKKSYSYHFEKLKMNG